MAKVQPAAPTGPPEPGGLVDLLVRTAFTTMAVLTKIAAEHNLSLTQLRVLAILRDRRLRMSDLADYLGLEKSTMSGLVDRAERKGLLERGITADDGRAVEVFLSPEGARFAEGLAERVAQALAPMTAGLTPAERARLSVLLSRTLGPAGA